MIRRIRAIAKRENACSGKMNGEILVIQMRAISQTRVLGVLHGTHVLKLRLSSRSEPQSIFPLGFFVLVLRLVIVFEEARSMTSTSTIRLGGMCS
jgi:hypothetical protein